MTESNVEHSTLSFEIRALAPHDAESIVQVLLQCPEAALLEYETPVAVGDYITRGGGISVGAFLGEKLTGVVLAFDMGLRVHVTHTGVVPSCRENGIARQMVDLMHQLLRGRLSGKGQNDVRVLLTAPTEDAKQFWKKMGYEQVDGETGMERMI